MVKKVRFTIDSRGEVSLDVQGAIGSECDRLTEKFEKKLGLVGNKIRKDGYFASEQSSIHEALAGDAND
jgi:hypothetical protein